MGLERMRRCRYDGREGGRGLGRYAKGKGAMQTRVFAGDEVAFAEGFECLGCLGWDGC